MIKIASILVSLLAFFYSELTLAGAVGPWVGNLNPAGAMVYYGTGAYGGSLSKMGVQALPTGNQIWSNAVGGSGMALKSTSALSVGASQVAVVVNGSLTAAAVFGTFKALLGGPVGIALTALTVAPAVIDWLALGKARFAAPTPGAAPQLERQIDSGCTTTFCDETAYQPAGPWFSSDAKACAAYASSMPLENGTAGTVNPNIAECTPTYYIRGIYYDQNFRGFYRRTVPAAGVTWQVTTPEEIRATMETVKVTLPLVNAILDTGASLPIAYAPNATSGQDSFSDVPVISTTTSGDYTTKATTTKKTDLTYGTAPSPETGATVPTVTAATNTVTVTTVTNNTTGAVTTTNTTVNNPQKPDSPSETATDSALPGQPKLYKQKYPDGLAGVWKTQHDLMAATPLFTLAKGLMPSVATSGQCPTMPVNLTFSKWANFGVKDVAPPCQVWDWGRAICIVSALLLARQLIFGG